MSHPYSCAPRKSFWSRAVSRNFTPSEVLSGEGPLLRAGDRVMTAGSCFASNLVPYLESAGFTYLRTEQRNPAFNKAPPENLGYDRFSAAYGNVYTARQMLQLVRRSVGSFTPAEDRWITPYAVIDPFRPGLRFPAKNEREFDAITKQHLRAVRDAFSQATALIFTLGLTEGWEAKADGAAYPACPGVIAGSFDEAKYRFVNCSVDEIVRDLTSMAGEIRVLNPSLRIILTVSPVPLVATATGKHVLNATVYSKSVLRVAAEEATRLIPNVRYFPAYEIVTGPQAPETFFEPDRRNVSGEAIKVVMSAFLSKCSGTGSVPATGGDGTAGRLSSRSSDLSDRVAIAECDEAMLDHALET
jgi:hypothetical protein